MNGLKGSPKRSEFGVYLSDCKDTSKTSISSEKSLDNPEYHKN